MWSPDWASAANEMEGAKIGTKSCCIVLSAASEMPGPTLPEMTPLGLTALERLVQYTQDCMDGRQG